jgi:N-ethylmaleimide reductase
MTRNRATGNVPNELMVQYYGSGPAMIITEGTPSPNGLGYPRIPGKPPSKSTAGGR